MTSEEQRTLLKILDKEPAHFIDEINWHGVVDKWPHRVKGGIDAESLKQRFFRMVQYRIPFYSHLTYSDIIELLQKHFYETKDED